MEGWAGERLVGYGVGAYTETLVTSGNPTSHDQRPSGTTHIV